MTSRAALAALCLVAAGCDRREPIARCSDNLHGEWSGPSGRWMLLDNGATLELFPLFDDSVADGAPRVIDVKRDAQMQGQIKRRFMRRADACDARASFVVTACKADTLQIVLGEVSAPLTYAPCTWPQSVPAHVETWQRQ